MSVRRSRGLVGTAGWSAAYVGCPARSTGIEVKVDSRVHTKS